MREGKIILPLADNTGRELGHVHDDLEAQLCEEFGGCTVVDGMGSWVDQGRLYREPVKVYTVAAIDDAINNLLLRGIAFGAGTRAKQQAVYFTGFDGIPVIANLVLKEEVAA